MRRSTWVAAAALLAAPAEAAHIVGSHGLHELQNVAVSLQGADRQLRVCNAFTFESGIDVFHLPYHHTSAVAPNWRDMGDSEEMLTKSSGPLIYKSCRDFGAIEGIGQGSLINLRFTSGLLLGGFLVQQDTAPGSLMQIVVYRYDSSTTAPDFLSHVFDGDTGKGSDPEVALVDTYRRPGNNGNGGAELDLFESGLFASDENRHARVHFDRAVTVRQGTYDWVLMGEGKYTQRYDGYRPNWTPPLVKKGSCSVWMRTGQRYTIIRVGNDAKVGPTYDEGILAYPDTWAACGSAMGGCQVSAVTATAIMLAWLTAAAPAGDR
jgi:hypothetical protein